MHTFNAPTGGIDGCAKSRLGRPPCLWSPSSRPSWPAASRWSARASPPATWSWARAGSSARAGGCGNASLQHAARSCEPPSRRGLHHSRPAQRLAFRVALPYLDSPDRARQGNRVRCEVTTGASARTWSSEDRAIFERFVGESRCLLFDAGCRAFHDAGEPATPRPEADRGIDLNEEAPAQIDVDAVPTVGVSRRFLCRSLGARLLGPDGFIVL